MPLDTLDIYILKPKAATNLVTNPSIERATTGYTAVNGSISRVNTYQRRGAYSLQVTPNTGVESGAYFGTVSMTNGVVYTFSADVRGVAGQTYSIQIRTTGGSVLAQTTFTGSGYWQRKSVTYTETATNSRRLYVVRSAVASTTPFHLDGFQCEVGNESSYIDGDLKGYLRNSIDYGWNGAPHGSTSWRSVQTRHGGEYVKLNSFLAILGIIGLGMAPINTAQTDLSLGGALYQKSTMDVRDFHIPILFNGDRWNDIQLDRKTLIDLIRPDGSTIQQPLTMVLQGKDSTGQENMERAIVPCVYLGGLEGKHENQKAEICNLQFRQYFPLIYADGEQAVDLLVNTTFSTVGMVRRTASGAWSSFSGSFEVYDLVYNPVDGRIYVAGVGTNWGGVSTNGIAAYDPATNTWSALGSGAGSAANIVYKLAVDAAGNVYAVGNFTSMGGAANSNRIARWNIATSTWTGLNSGLVGTGATLEYVKVAPNGLVYACGRFTSINGVSANAVAVYNGSVWASLGWATDVYTGPLAIDKNGNVYLAHAGSPYVSVYNGTSWTGLNWDGQVQTAPPSDAAMDDKGTFYGGNQLVAYWNGSRFVTLSYGSTLSITGLDILDNGELWIAGFSLATTSGIILPDQIARYEGGVLVPPDIRLPVGASTPRVVLRTPNGDFYIGGSMSGTSTASNVVTTSLSSSLTYPVIKITGPGRVWSVINNTTGKGIYFNGLTLNSGEVVEINLEPGNIFAKSTHRGNIMNYLTSGTSFDFPLVPGDNYLSLFMTDTDGNTAAVMRYKTAYWSLDGAAR